MPRRVCEHLRALEDELVASGRKIPYAGRPRSAHCRYWIAFDVLLDCGALKKRPKLGDGVTVHVNDDPRSGREIGLVYGACKDAIIGVHPEDAKGRAVIS